MPHDYPLRGIVTGNVEEIVRFLPRLAHEQPGLDRCAALAAANGQQGILKLLHENGANVLAEDQLALRLAVATGKSQVVEYLLKHGGADPGACSAQLVK